MKLKHCENSVWCRHGGDELFHSLTFGDVYFERGMEYDGLVKTHQIEEEFDSIPHNDFDKSDRFNRPGRGKGACGQDATAGESL